MEKADEICYNYPFARDVATAVGFKSNSGQACFLDLRQRFKIINDICVFFFMMIIHHLIVNF